MLVKVLIDHKGLEYFMSVKKLTSRQERWAEFLSEYNFVISYQSGKKNDKADTLTRKPHQRLMDSNDKRLEHCMQTLLPPERFEYAVNLQLIKNANDAKPQLSTTNAEHRPAISKYSTLSEKIQISN